MIERPPSSVLSPQVGRGGKEAFTVDDA